MVVLLDKRTKELVKTAIFRNLRRGRRYFRSCLVVIAAVAAVLITGGISAPSGATAAPVASSRLSAETVAHLTASVTTKRCFGVAPGSSLPNVEQASPKLFHQTLLDAAADHCWIRVDVQWRFIQPSQTAPLYWGPYGVTLKKIEAFNASRPKGDRIGVLADVEYAPPWANPAEGSVCSGGTLCGPDSAHAGAYGAFVADTVRYMLRLTDTRFQIIDWNEANTTYFSPVPNPGIYAAMACDAFRDARAVDRSVQLLFSGMAPWGPTGRFIEPPEFLRRAYAAGAKGCFTEIGMHIGRNGVQQLEAVRKVAVAHGDGKLPIVIDELAVPTPQSKIPSKVVRYMTGVLAQISHLSWVGNVLWYGPPGDPGWGLYTKTGRMKAQLLKPITAAERLAAG